MQSKDSYVPVYIQVKNHFLQKIKNGEYSENEKLPTEQQIADKWGISKLTVRQGLQQLVQEGYLYTKRGVGIFVQSNKLSLDTLHFAPFSKVLGGTITTIVLNFKKQLCPVFLIDKISGWRDKDLWLVERLRFYNKSPAMLEITYMPCDLYPSLTKEICKESKYAFVNSNGLSKIDHSDRVFRAINASKDVSVLLKVPEQSPLIKIESLAYLKNGIPFEYADLYYNSEICEIKGTLPYKGN